MKLMPGKEYPLGANYDGMGTNFSLFSEAGERVILCLFDEDDNETQVEFLERTDGTWHGYLNEVQPGQRYGYRVDGLWDPASGKRFNSSKLLLDPYAKAIDGAVQWNQAVFSYSFSDPDGEPNRTDSARFMPKCVVINPFYNWLDDRHPHTSLHESVIYEAHVKALTYQHPDIPEDIRGTYAAIEHPVMLDYFDKLGITTIELMPVHQFVHDSHLLEKGLSNFWGYNSIGFFAPHTQYAAMGKSGQQVQEFKHMVQVLHQHDIEVILDVVYNHTAEGNHLGPTLSFKGIDNEAYYRLMDNDRRYYMDYTGTGNTLNLRHPRVLQLVMDSLRYWVLEMHVDGFRFDLASALARGLHEVERLGAFFDLIQQEPVISQVKLIAEPWDIGEGGYQVGNFPPLWSEWNGKYRDSMRDFWRGQCNGVGEFARRFSGSADLYESTGRRPHASVNFVTAHDGFSLQDLVSYNEKHNEANKDNNQDGESHNRSWNGGIEGPTNDMVVTALRAKQKRNFLATLLLSQGVPMVLSGDEMGHTKQGNNNTYCQDNELSWLNWEATDEHLVDYVSHLITIRNDHPTFRRWKWFKGPQWDKQETDIGWYRPDGQLFTQEDWETGFARALLVFLNGKEIAGVDERGDRVIDTDFYLLFNASDKPITFVLPKREHVMNWNCVVDTSRLLADVSERAFGVDEEVVLEAHSMVVLEGVEKKDE